MFADSNDISTAVELIEICSQLANVTYWITSFAFVGADFAFESGAAVLEGRRLLPIDVYINYYL